jgi:thiamine pyrophosphate-dependent acetolactate synthase large subunit-like protein
VLIDFPIDILFSTVQPNRISWGAITSPFPFPPGPNSDAVLEAISLLKAAKRPVIIAGTGVRAGEVLLSLFGKFMSTDRFFAGYRSTERLCGVCAGAGFS